MSAPENKSHVYLAVSDFGADAGVVSSLLGLAPTEVWLAGDALPRQASARRTHSCWKYQSPLPLHAHPDDHLEALLPLLEPHAARIRDCATRFPTELCCAIYYRDFSPGIHLSAKVLHLITALGIDLDFDLYYLGGEEGDSETATHE